jgi:hypothetical protein
VVVRGEGIVGLAAPLIEAGARSIALTRWTIGDRQTVSFIEAFYRALAAGQPVVDALRTAKLDAIARGAPPAQWAAFTIIGNPAVAIPLTLPSRRPGFALVLSAALLVLLASGWVWRRRSRPPR